eukprot:4273509-Amphidinium_carterae.1
MHYVCDAPRTGSRGWAKLCNVYYPFIACCGENSQTTGECLPVSYSVAATVRSLNHTRAVRNLRA